MPSDDEIDTFAREVELQIRANEERLNQLSGEFREGHMIRQDNTVDIEDII